MLPTISDKEFKLFRDLIYQAAGIHLSDAKKALVSGRLGRRLRHFDLDSFHDYYEVVKGNEHPEEMQVMVDLLTTNETYFFREPRHFDLLRQRIIPEFRGAGGFRAWSAACSTGAEPYSIAMVLADQLSSNNWRILATDISNRVLETARAGLYPIDEAKTIPRDYLNRYCMKGVRSQEGNFLIERSLRERIDFRQFNLNGGWSGLDTFHVVFLRNVMIYFNQETKARLVERIVQRLVPGGYLIVGHSESLNGIDTPLRLVTPSVYHLK